MLGSKVLFMKSFRLLTFVLCSLGLSNTAILQTQDTWNLKQQKLNKAGMYSLLSWSGVNIGTGIIGNYTLTGERKYFHQMNAMWNVVNLGLATSGLIQERKRDLHAPDSVWMNSNKRFQRIFAINTALDFVYMGTGAVLAQRDSERMKGYGKSLIVQGAFLAVFDGIMWYKHKKQFKRNNNNLTTKIGLSGMQIVYCF